ncbi:hypothetical protein AeNC1_003446, partial [Aphanomyces euteiches]
SHDSSTLPLDIRVEWKATAKRRQEEKEHKETAWKIDLDCLEGFCTFTFMSLPAPLLQRHDSGYFQRDSINYVTAPPTSLFEKHLQEIYSSTTPIDGLKFFESAGYYDDSEGNTVLVFMKYAGLESFWGEETDPTNDESPVKKTDIQQYEENEENAVKEELFHDYMQSRAAVSKIHYETLKLRSNLEQTTKAGNNKETIAAIDRLRLKLFCDQDLEDETDDEGESEASFAGNYLAGINLNTPPSAMPPFYGHMRVLKPGRIHFFGSFNKRWFFLDFAKGELSFFQRSYWKIPKGKIDMKSVARISPINKTDFTIELIGENSLYVRASTAEKMQSWVTLLLYARKQARQHDAMQTLRPIATNAFNSKPPSFLRAQELPPSFASERGSRIDSATGSHRRAGSWAPGKLYDRHKFGMSSSSTVA